MTGTPPLTTDCPACEGHRWQRIADGQRIDCTWCVRLIEVPRLDAQGRSIPDGRGGTLRDAVLRPTGYLRLTERGIWVTCDHCAGRRTITAPGCYSDPCGACRVLSRQGRKRSWRALGIRPLADIEADPHPRQDIPRGVLCVLGQACMGHWRGRERGRDLREAGTWAARVDSHLAA